MPIVIANPAMPPIVGIPSTSTIFKVSIGSGTISDGGATMTADSLPAPIAFDELPTSDTELDTLASEVGKYYMELQISGISSDLSTGSNDFAMGWHRQATVGANYPSIFHFVGMYWDSDAQSLQVNRSSTGTSAYGIDAGPENNVPVDSDIWGIGLDLDAQKFYVHVNGVWQVGGTFGGVPSGGNGFPILASSGYPDIFWVGCEGLLTVTNIVPNYAPAGFTTFG